MDERFRILPCKFQRGQGAFVAQVAECHCHITQQSLPPGTLKWAALELPVE